MKVSREQATANRERILTSAAQLFRERGFDGVGVADLMKHAGLTHGGFYGHFESKQDLMAQACEHVHAPKLESWKHLAETRPEQALAKIVTDYLRPEHRDTPGSGCILAALAAEAPRHGAGVKRVLTGATQGQLSVLSNLIPGKNKRERSEKALMLYSGMVGALVLSRAMDDPKLSADFLKSVAARLLRSVASAEP